ncbi:MAG: T9SS type A sorting domain-containing protein [Flavobacterium sp.]|nr:MAG: T9SS type A sorting domain-containing protein [Flavobacterium sp.]
MKQIYILIAALFAIGAGAQCTPPEITATSEGVTACEGTSAILSATSDSGTLSWYASATGGTPLNTGATYTTQNLAETTSFWVEAATTGAGTPQAGGGKTTHGSSASAVAPATPPWGLVFNATQDFTLNSVVVYVASPSAGSLVVELKNSSLVVLQTVTVATPAGGTAANPIALTVPLNFTVPAGNGYRLVSPSSPSMIRDFSSENTYPYPIGNVGSITQGTINNGNANATVYYFFYNWNFTPAGQACVSEREEVVVTVTPAPDAPEVEDQEFCGQGFVAGLLDEGEDLQWYNTATGGMPLEADVPLTSGTYYVTQIINGCESARGAVQVTINVTPEPAADDQSFCGNGTVGDLMATGQNLNWYEGTAGLDALAAETPLVSGSYYVSQTINNCEGSRTEIVVTVTPVPTVPEGSAQQSFEEGETLADLEVAGTDLTWYTDMDGNNPIPATTLLTDGTTYYATQTIDGCEGPALAITVVQVLSNSDFAFSQIQYYPNPVADKFTINNSQEISSVEVYSLQGQLISKSGISANTAEIDFSPLSSGIYIVKVMSGTSVKNIRVSKK